MLDTIELFAGLTLKELQDVENICRRSTLNRGEVIFQQGDFARDLYIIESGQVEISVKDIMQSQKTVAVLKNGEFFGEMALFDKNSIRSATAKTLQNTSLIIIPGDEFERLLHGKPTISFKLLRALSNRLKETTVKTVLSSKTQEKTEGTVISVASARNGFGKTTFAATLASLLAQELPKKVLYIDMDLYFADGTFFMGVVSPKSICDLAKVLAVSQPTESELHKYLVRHSETLFTLPAPNNLLDGDRISCADLISILKVCKQYFSYIIVDTDSNVSDLFLNTIDMSDHVFFLVDTSDLLSVKSSTRYFQGLAKLNYPENRMSILVSRVAADFNPEQVAKLFKYRLRGGLPAISNLKREFGQNLYKVAPQSDYCEVVRMLVRGIFKEELVQKKEENSNFLYRLFFDAPKESVVAKSSKLAFLDNTGYAGDVLIIPEDHLSVLMKYVKTNIIYGNFEEARFQAIKLLEYSSDSGALYQLLGEILFADHQFSQAIDALKRSLELEKDNHLAMGLLAHISGDKELMKQSLDLLKGKIEQNPRYPDLQNDYGKLLMQTGQFAESSVFFEAALAINPHYLESRINLTVALSECKRHDDAVKLLLETSPKNIRVYYLLGKIFYETGKFAEALTAFTLAADINGNYYDVGPRLTQLRDYFKRLQSLLDMHNDLLRTHANYPDLRFKVGNLLMLMGRRQEAETEFREALKINPGYERARKGLERLKATPEIQLKRASTETEQKGGGSSISGEQLVFLIELEEELKSSEKEFFSREFSIRIKNIRTGKGILHSVRDLGVADHTFSFEGKELGVVAELDILVIQLFDPSSERMIGALPISVGAEAIAQKLVQVRFSENARKMVSGARAATPVRHFLVNLRSQALAGTLSAETGFQAILCNNQTGVSTKGSISPENPNEINFVLSSNNGKDVVRVHDKIQLKVLDQRNAEVFAMDLAIVPENLETFSKTISLDEMDAV
jgi:CRP-like cAMP-binding protein/tetratricopeptide (TPR) repeat protein